jgi:hypothetical protein
MAVDEDGGGANVADRIHGGDEGETRDRDLVARTDAEAEQREVDRDGAVADRQGLFDVHIVGECLFKARDELAARGNPGGLEALPDVLPLLFAE